MKLDKHGILEYDYEYPKSSDLIKSTDEYYIPDGDYWIKFDYFLKGHEISSINNRIRRRIH